MQDFIPSDQPDTVPAAAAVKNDGWYPDLTVSDFFTQTGCGPTFGYDRVAAAIQSAMISVNASIAVWRSQQAVASLLDVQALRYGDQSEKIICYQTAVYSLARSNLLRQVRDYDSTKDGHDRADKLELTADDWERRSAEAVARLIGRARMVVDLI